MSNDQEEGCTLSGVWRCGFVLSCWSSLKDPAFILMIVLFSIWLVLYLTPFSPSLGLSKSRFWIPALLVSIRNAIVCRRTASCFGPSAVSVDTVDYHQRLVMNNQTKLQWRSAYKFSKVSFLFCRIKVRQGHAPFIYELIWYMNSRLIWHLQDYTWLLLIHVLSISVGNNTTY